MGFTGLHAAIGASPNKNSSARTALRRLRQLGDVGGDAPGFIAPQQVRRRASAGLVLEIDVRERLHAGDAEDEAGVVRFVDRPRRREAAGLGHSQGNLEDRFSTFLTNGGRPMPKAYAVVCYHSAPDPQKFAAYVKLASAAVAPFGARYLARSTASAAYEDGLRERTIIAEYPSLEKAIAARESAAYGEALKALGDGVVRDFRIVEGLE